MLSFRLHPAAEQEAVEAIHWIRSDDPYQAELFVEALENAILRARKQHQLFPCFDDGFRKVRVGKFTYAVVFRVVSREVQILAVMHLHRKPGYWKERVMTL
jgi:plasmid stabilization system protein ParE